MKKDANGNDVDEQLPVFDYTAKKLVSINILNEMTSHFAQSDIRKFSKCCPSEISRAIVRLLDPITGVVPKSYRIVQDIWRGLYCIEEIVKAGGAVVPALVNRNGHRAKGTGTGRHYVE
jgi:hypothetical protein